MNSKGKKEDLILTNQKNSTLPNSNNGDVMLSNAIDVYEQTSKQIEEGINKKYASTGTPMTKLNGGAYYMAELSNIGGGSKETGGGGVQEGFDTVAKNVSARSSILTNEALQNQNNKIETN